MVVQTYQVGLNNNVLKIIKLSLRYANGSQEVISSKEDAGRSEPVVIDT